MSKHKNQPCMMDGYKFPSLAERDRYIILKSRLQSGEISGLVLQPTFVILPAFHYWGKRIQAVTFTADFKYSMPQKNKQDQIIVEDVKGMTARLTEAFGIRWKFVKAQNPTIKFRIVRM